MHLLKKWSIFFLISLLIDLKVVECRRNVGRGGSASRGAASPGGLNGGGSGGTGLGSASRGGTFSRGGGGISSFTKGSGTGSLLRSSTFKAAIAGAAAGYLTYQAGKAIINLAGGAMMWGGRDYYWGQNYYRPRSGYEMCSMPLINSTDTTFNDVYFSNGTRPKMIVWGCRSYTEYCCGYECCPTPQNGVGGGIWGFFIIGLIVFLLFLCCGCFIMYKFFRKTLDCILPSNNDDVKFTEYPMSTTGPMYNQTQQPFVQQPAYYPPQPQSYSQQPPPYASQPYPSQPYPSQPYPSQPYPSQPYPTQTH